VKKCSGGSCNAESAAPNGATCPFNLTSSQLCGTCVSQDCTIQAGDNLFCHQGASNTNCNSTAQLQCAPCPGGTNPCLFVIPGPIPGPIPF
jgi:hypothetical protein